MLNRCYAILPSYPSPTQQSKKYAYTNHPKPPYTSSPKAPAPYLTPKPPAKKSNLKPPPTPPSA